MLDTANVYPLGLMGLEIYIAGYMRLLVSRNTVVDIIYSSLLALNASRFNIAGYAKLQVSRNMV